ncbi:MAG: class I SAM-dependent methyltransferase [Spirulinaceae cyanobacterium SM2_1_0]|nr:class I SAM-dependent methyltransferase [Spirulinaceae cyanobacterium SM2_1_0]
MNRLQIYLCRQLSHPSGWGGRLLLRLLNRGNASMNQLALAQLALQPGQRVLELGFGGGDLLQRLLQMSLSLQVTGIDPSAAAMGFVQRRFRRAIASQQLTLHLAAAEAIPSVDRQFAAVVTVNTLYFWSEADIVLRECARVLQPGGRLAIAYASRAFLEQRQMTQYGFTAYDPPDLEHRLQYLGFVDIQTVTGESAGNGQFFCTCGTADLNP